MKSSRMVRLCVRPKKYPCHMAVSDAIFNVRLVCYVIAIASLILLLMLYQGIWRSPTDGHQACLSHTLTVIPYDNEFITSSYITHRHTLGVIPGALKKGGAFVPSFKSNGVRVVFLIYIKVFVPSPE